MNGAIVLERVPCPRCGSQAVTPKLRTKDFLHGIAGEFVVAACDRCGLWFQNPRPTAESLGEAYPESYAPHGSVAADPPLEPRIAGFLEGELGYGRLPMERRGALRSWQRWKSDVDLIPRFVAGGSLLEIGSGAGGRLRALSALGWTNMTGVELVTSAADAGRRDGFSIITGEALDVIQRLPSAAYDVVIASFVLEHLPQPFELVAEIARVLRPGGEFLFSTVVRDGVDARVWGRYWSGYDHPRHLVHFEMRDLRAMVSADFDWISDRRHAAIQDFQRAAWWRFVDRRNMPDLVVNHLVKRRAGATLVNLLAWLGLTSRVSVRCRRKG